MNELEAALRISLGNTFTMYFKAHSYHWNVEGMLFSQYHDFFSDLYEELFDSVDTYAEQLRALDVYAPISIAALYDNKTVEEDIEKPDDITGMLENLQTANNQVIETLNKLFDLATNANEQGLADFAAGRIDVHKKHGWMLRASLKKVK